MLRDAHAEDFERKRKPELGRDPRNTKVEEEDDSDDESEGEEERDSDGEVEDVDDEQESALSRIREDLEVGMSGSGRLSR